MLLRRDCDCDVVADDDAKAVTVVALSVEIIEASYRSLSLFISLAACRMKLFSNFLLILRQFLHSISSSMCIKETLSATQLLLLQGNASKADAG